MNVGIVSNGKNVPDKNNIGKVTTFPAASASSSSRTTVEIIIPIPGNVSAPDMMSMINNGFRIFTRSGGSFQNIFDHSSSNGNGESPLSLNIGVCEFHEPVMQSLAVGSVLTQSAMFSKSRSGLFS